MEISPTLRTNNLLWKFTVAATWLEKQTMWYEVVVIFMVHGGGEEEEEEEEEEVSESM